MTKRTETIAKIIDYLLSTDMVSTHDISKDLDISERTARRTLKILVEMSHEFNAVKFSYNDTSIGKMYYGRVVE